METNIVGPSAALATFLGIWIGHVFVRRIEYTSTSIVLPTISFACAGLALLIGSILTSSSTVSVVLGILGITALWDAYEFPRQQLRIIKGHSPANPANPRHARILKEHSSATPVDLLKRAPVGRAVDKEEAFTLAEAEV
jgi:hypothetical protein